MLFIFHHSNRSLTVTTSSPGSCGPSPQLSWLFPMGRGRRAERYHSRQDQRERSRLLVEKVPARRGILSVAHRMPLVELENPAFASGRSHPQARVQSWLSVLPTLPSSVQETTCLSLHKSSSSEDMREGIGLLCLLQIGVKIICGVTLGSTLFFLILWYDITLSDYTRHICLYIGALMDTCIVFIWASVDKGARNTCTNPTSYVISRSLETTSKSSSKLDAHAFVILVLRNLRQENHLFKASLR